MFLLHCIQYWLIVGSENILHICVAQSTALTPLPKAYTRKRFGLTPSKDTDKSPEEEDEQTRSATKILGAVDAMWDSDNDADFHVYKRARRRRSFGERKAPRAPDSNDATAVVSQQRNGAMPRQRALRRREGRTKVS